MTINQNFGKLVNGIRTKVMKVFIISNGLNFENSPELQEEIFILHGYPRAVTAAKKLLETFDRLNIPIIKVLHLFITKEQMRVRASKGLQNIDESIKEVVLSVMQSLGLPKFLLNFECD